MPVDGGIRPRAAFSHGIDGLHGDVVVPFSPTGHVERLVQVVLHIARHQVQAVSLFVGAGIKDVPFARGGTDAQGVGQVGGWSQVILSRLPVDLQHSGCGIGHEGRHVRFLRGLVSGCGFLLKRIKEAV